MQIDDPNDATVDTRVSLLDALNWLEDEYAALSAAAQRQAELIAIGMDGVAGDLAIALWAECAARGVDWTDLLARATERCITPARAN